MALTGFNPQQVKSSIKSVIDAYNDLYDALITVTQQSFVTPMANYWCCKEAVTFFNQAFKPAMDSLQDGAQKTFISIVDSMNSAADSWAKRTGNTDAWSKVSFTPRTQKIDVSAIKDKNAKGEIGIDEVQAVAKAALLVTKSYVKAARALAKAAGAVTVCGFLGGTQAADLRTSLKAIQRAIDETTKDMADGIKKAVKDSADNYASVGVSVASAFIGGK